MAFNLVSLIEQFLTPDIIARIATALGIDSNKAQTAIRAAVPGLLAGLVGAASKPSGVQRLAEAVGEQSGALDTFASMLPTGRQSSLVDSGSRLLATLLGGTDLSALAGAVAKFAGLGENTGGALLGMLAPVITGMIGKQLGSVDTGSVASLLNSQKDNIVRALPPGFGDLLAGTGLLNSLGGFAGATAAAAGQVKKAAAATTEPAARAGATAGRSMSDAGHRAAGAAASGVPAWLYWLVAVVVVAGLLWYFFGYRAHQATEPTSATSIESVTIGGVDIGKQLGDNLTALRTSLEGVTDAATAKAALPKLGEISTQIDKVSGMLGQLSPDQKKVIAGLVGPAMATLNQLFDKVLALPGVGEVLKPTLNSLKTKLASLSGAA